MSPYAIIYACIKHSLIDVLSLVTTSPTSELKTCLNHHTLFYHSINTKGYAAKPVANDQAKRAKKCSACECARDSSDTLSQAVVPPPLVASPCNCTESFTHIITHTTSSSDVGVVVNVALIAPISGSSK